MEEIDYFLREFGTEIFPEHFEIILAFRIKYRNIEIIMSDLKSCLQRGDITDTCSCFNFIKEKERVTKLIARYYKLTRMFSDVRG